MPVPFSFASCLPQNGTEMNLTDLCFWSSFGGLAPS